jgi:regulatory protein
VENQRFSTHKFVPATQSLQALMKGMVIIMVVTRFEELEQSKVKVYIDEEYAFLLYQKDIKQYKLEEGAVITSENYVKIIEDTVFRRAKQKAVAILKFMNRTEQELRKKLSEAEYTDSIIDRTIAYLYEYGYIDDERYAAAFVRSKMNTKSKLVIKTLLIQKGINKEIINNIFMAEYSDDDKEDPELLAIKRAIAKKTKSLEDLTPEKKQKLLASLYRKGFDLSKIKQILFEER